SAEKQRLAQQAIEARESQVFFRIEDQSRQTDLASSGQSVPQRFGVPLPQSDAARAPASAAPAEGDQNNQERKLDFISQRNT
ncbi:MAG: conjugal transfer protein TrbI, partial [Mesorhizobium sp.]